MLCQNCDDRQDRRMIQSCHLQQFVASTASILYMGLKIISPLPPSVVLGGGGIGKSDRFSSWLVSSSGFPYICSCTPTLNTALTPPPVSTHHRRPLCSYFLANFQYVQALFLPLYGDPSRLQPISSDLVTVVAYPLPFQPIIYFFLLFCLQSQPDETTMTSL